MPEIARRARSKERRRAKQATRGAAIRAISGIPVEWLFLSLGLPRERPLAALRALRIVQYSRRRASLGFLSMISVKKAALLYTFVRIQLLLKRR